MVQVGIEMETGEWLMWVIEGGVCSGWLTAADVIEVMETSSVGFASRMRWIALGDAESGLANV